MLDSWKRNGGRHITQFFVLVGHQSVHGVLQAAHIEPCSGPPQPSMVFRYLRMLEGVSPALALTHTACQASAKAFVATRRSRCSAKIGSRLTYSTVFDRMFSLGIRGSGIDGAPLGRIAVSSTAATPRRHFLYCTLKLDSGLKMRKSKDQT